MSAMPAEPLDDLEEQIEAVLEALDAPAQGALDAEGDRYRIGGMKEADWAARKLQQAVARLGEARATVNHQVDAINAVAAARTAPLLAHLEEEERAIGHDVAYFETLLAEWHRVRLGENEREKTIKLPSGVQLHARKQPDVWEFDEAPFVSWAKDAHPELVRVKEEPDKAAAKKALCPVGLPETGYAHDVATADGEAVPGVAVTPGEVRFTVDVPA